MNYRRVKKVMWLSATFFIITVSVIMLIGYFIISHMPKNVVWIKGNIHISGNYDPKKKESLFSRIYLGLPDNFLYHDQDIPVTLEFLHGQIIPLSELTASTIEGMQNTREDWGYSSICGYYGPSWPENMIAMRMSGPDTGLQYKFAIVDNEIVGVILFGGEGCQGFWDKSETKRYTFPLTQNEIEDLFGKPDDINMWREIPLPNW